jgi:hypothetical protein
MDNPEEVMQSLERFNIARNPEITASLEEYITFVARTGDSVYAWSLVKNLYREKLIHVITDFYNETPTKGELKLRTQTSSDEVSALSRIATVPERGSLQLRDHEEGSDRETRLFRGRTLHDSAY